MAYNLTDKQVQLVRDLVRLCQLSQHKSFSYTPTFNSRDTLAAHGASEKAAGSERDLRALDSEKLITLRWVRHGAANGTVLPRAFDAVRENFGLPREGPPAAVAAPVADEDAAACVSTGAVVARGTAHAQSSTPAPLPAPAATPAHAPAPVPDRATSEHRPPAVAAPAASGGELLYRLSRSIADLSATFRETLPLDEAEAADADAAAINRQLHARQPDPEVVARRTRSIVARVSIAMNGAADLADRGPKYADALGEVASFIGTVSQWIAAHRRGG
jgi:hypothetical protein